MRAGDMDRRITIQRYEVVGDDGYGNEITGWNDVATVWAEVRQESGREFFASGAIQAERKVTFKLRPVDVTVIDRVSYDDRLFDIHDVRELGRKEGVELHTTSIE